MKRRCVPDFDLQNLCVYIHNIPKLMEGKLKNFEDPNLKVEISYTQTSLRDIVGTL